MKKLLVCAIAFPFLSAAAADYLGAKAVLEKAYQEASTPAAQGDTTSLKDAVAAFGKKAPTLAPAEAATQWLALANRLQTNGRGYGDEYVEFPALVKVLPPPAAWPDLQANSAPPANTAFKARAQGLLVAWFASRLLGDAKAMKSNYDAFIALKNPDANRSSGDDSSALQSLADSTLALQTDPEVRVKLLDGCIDGMISAAKQAVERGNDNYRAPNFPDVALMVDQTAARKLITRALTECTVPLEFNSDTATSRMAANVALERLDSLAAPQWALTCSFDGGPLYDRLLARFGPALSQEKFRSAREFAFYRAILDKRTDDALDLARQMGGTFEPDSYSLNSLVDAGRGAEVCQVLHDVLEKTSNPPLWNAYIDVAARAGLTGPMMKLLDSTLASATVGGSLRKELEEARISALLATDKIDEAGALLSKQVAAASGTDIADKGLKLARLGAVLDRKEWFEQGLAADRKELAKLLAVPGTIWNGENYAESISNLLLDADRGPEAEAVWLDVLAASIAAQDNEEDGYSISANTMPEALCGLVGVYAAAGRNDDILVLANQAKNWGAGDLAKIFQKSCSVGKRHSEPLGVVVARSLVATGHREEAAKMIGEMIPFLNGDDSAYALLVELHGQAALPLLDKLAALDAFEERPLIWKAKLLLDAGKLDDAESTARKAISIDPSDGEEGPGDRMRVYAVLADILAAKGNAKDAELFRNVVASIRMSEQADVLYELGLLERAIKLYEDSLLRFADAYCIQSRLALRLAESGDWKGAEEHYRRAYELMPDSFGRVESHCFGCERAFAGIPQQSLAEKVFKNLAKEQPAKPQVHYLLGYLYEEQDRIAEAIPEFRKAVELDPDYLNAWKKLADAPAAALTPVEHDRIAANLLRLDPGRQHYSLELDGAGDLTAIWMQLEKAADLVPGRPEKLYPLRASAKRQDELAVAAKTNPNLRYYLSRDDYEKGTSPGGVFSNQNFAENVGRLMNMIVSRSTED